MTEVISELYLRLMRGRKLYRDGQPCPQSPYDMDGNPIPGVSEDWKDHVEWMGWRLEYADDYMRRKAIKESLEEGGSLPD